MSEWERPIYVLVDGRTKIRVGTSLKAAQTLLYRWPERTGPKHLAARKAVLKAMERAVDLTAQAAARMAFQAAAEEAGIDIVDQTPAPRPEGRGRANRRR